MEVRDVSRIQRAQLENNNVGGVLTVSDRVLHVIVGPAAERISAALDLMGQRTGTSR